MLDTVTGNPPSVCIDCQEVFGAIIGSVSTSTRLREQVSTAMELLNKIRKYGFENGEMTQRQLAESVGVRRQTMNAIENCKHATRIDVAIRIADVFGVSVDQVFEYDYEGKPERRPIARSAEPALSSRSTERGLDVPARHANPDVSSDARERGGATDAREHDFGLADLRNMF